MNQYKASHDLLHVLQSSQRYATILPKSYLETLMFPVRLCHYKKVFAISYAYNTAKPGSLVTIMCDVVSEALDLIKNMKEMEDAEAWS